MHRPRMRPQLVEYKPSRTGRFSTTNSLFQFRRPSGADIGAAPPGRAAPLGVTTEVGGGAPPHHTFQVADGVATHVVTSPPPPCRQQ